MKKYFVILFISLFFSCKTDKKTEDSSKRDSKKEIFNDSLYVLNKNFKVGDVRRYGIYPDSTFGNIHPKTKISKFQTVLNIAENHGVELFFPKGYYGRGLFLESKKNIKINFDNAEFNTITISAARDSIIKKSENIRFKGTVISYGGLAITKAIDVLIDSVYIKTNLHKNVSRSRGCHIYAGAENVTIKYLYVDDLGSGSKKYINNHAALAIDGYKNNPVNVQIKKVHIKSSDRHGAYITGSDHIIDELIIDKFGVGSSKHMSGMQDANNKIEEHKEFKGLWVNRCYDSFIEKVTINTKDSKGKYAIHFDEGDKNRPVTIGRLKILNPKKSIKSKVEPKTGVIVEIDETK